MQQSAQNNLFTTFNNIEKIKKSKEERMLKPVISKATGVSVYELQKVIDKEINC